MIYKNDIKTCYIYLISLIITISYAQTVSCTYGQCIINCDDEHPCKGLTINFPSYINSCTINCNAKEACRYTIINCPSNNADCYINCYRDHTCFQTTIS